MTKLPFSGLFGLGIALTLAAGSVLAAQTPSPTDAPPVLRLAIVNSYGESIMSKYYSRSIEAIRESIRPITLQVQAYGPDGFLKAAHEKAFDMSIASSGITSLMIEHTGGLPLMAISTNEAPDPNHANGTTIIVRADRLDLQTIRDLRGQRLAIMSRNAFAGWQIPASELVKKGINPDGYFKEIRISGDPMTKIVQQVRAGEVDVGFVASCLLERMARQGDISLSDFRVIDERHSDRFACRHSTALYPAWFFSLKPTVPPHVARTITSTLLSLPPGCEGSQWTVPTEHRRLYDVFRLIRVPYGDPHDIWWHMKELRPFLIGMGIAILLFLLNTMLLVRLARRRTRQLEKAMREKMDAELAAQQNALQVESLTRASVVGLLSSMVAHELKQPLTVIGNYTGSLRRRLTRGDVPKETLLTSLAEIEESGARAAAIIDRVRNYGQVRKRDLTRVDLSELTHSAIASWRKHAAQSVPCRLAVKPDVMIEADRLEIELALLNLVKNAAAAVKGLDYPQIEVTLHTDGGYAWLVVEDNGPALSDEAIERMSKIGYTTKPEGLGLGVAIVHSLLEAHGGALIIRRRRDLGGRGLSCTIKLPLPTHAPTA